MDSSTSNNVLPLALVCQAWLPRCRTKYFTAGQLYLCDDSPWQLFLELLQHPLCTLGWHIQFLDLAGTPPSGGWIDKSTGPIWIDEFLPHPSVALLPNVKSLGLSHIGLVRLSAPTLECIFAPQVLSFQGCFVESVTQLTQGLTRCSSLLNLTWDQVSSSDSWTYSNPSISPTRTNSSIATH